MINRKNKPATGLNISQFVADARQNIRPVGISVMENTTTEDTKDNDTVLNSVREEAEAVLVPEAEELPEAKEEVIPDEPEKGTDRPEAEKNKRGRRAVQKAVKRDKFIAVRFDKKMHKEISRIKLDYEIDIQDFIYVAVERFKEEFFPNGKASKEGLDIIKQAIDKINGKTLDE